MEKINNHHLKIASLITIMLLIVWLHSPEYLPLYYAALFIGITLKVISRFIPVRFKLIIINHLTNFKKELENNDTERIYINCILMFLYAFVSYKIIDHNALTILLIATAYLIYATTRDAIKLYEYIDTKFKVLGGWIFTALSTYAYGQASQMVSTSVSASSSNLTKTVFFTSIAFIPLTLISALAVISFLYNILSLLGYKFQESRSSKVTWWFFPEFYRLEKPNRFWIKFIFRSIAYPAIFLMTFSITQSINSIYKNEINDILSYSIYELDLYYGNECKNTMKDFPNLKYKISPLGDNKYLIGTDNNQRINFSIIKCEI